MQKNIYFTEEDQRRLDFIRFDTGEESDAGCIRRLIQEEYLRIHDTTIQAGRDDARKAREEVKA